MAIDPGKTEVFQWIRRRSLKVSRQRDLMSRSEAKYQIPRTILRRKRTTKSLDGGTVPIWLPRCAQSVKNGSMQDHSVVVRQLVRSRLKTIAHLVDIAESVRASVGKYWSSLVPYRGKNSTRVAGLRRRVIIKAQAVVLSSISDCRRQQAGDLDGNGRKKTIRQRRGWNFGAGSKSKAPQTQG
jgi:hypothetical protein